MVRLALATRKGNPIDNWHDAGQPIYGEMLEADSLRARYPRAVHRPTSVCYTYNCHGMTFAARRTAITDPAEIRKVLEDDGYERVLNSREISAGDIAIYVSSSGDIEHSGIVVETAGPDLLVVNPKIVSKWGNAHEVIHHANDSPYLGSAVHYYRVVR